MRRRIAVLVAVAAAAGVAVVAFWLVAGRGGNRGASGATARQTVAACLSDRTAFAEDSATQQPPTFLTLQDVSQRYDWFRFPSELPPGGALTQLVARHRPCQPDVITISARIDGPSYYFLLDQSTFTATSGDPTTPIAIDGGPGEVSSNEIFTFYSWNRNRHNYQVSTEFGGELTPETLLRSMNTLAKVSKDEISALCNDLTPAPTAKPMVSVPIDQADELMGFNLLLPQELPDRVTQYEPFVTDSPSCPGNPLHIEINYAGPDYSFALSETKLTPELGSPATPVKVNGFEGEMRVVDDFLRVQWRQGGVTITATTVMQGPMTQERFLQILESIPD